MDNLVTVKTFDFVHDMAMVRLLLEAEGIECFTKDELTAQVNPFYSNAIGGIKLQVKQADVEKTVALLKANNYLTDEELEDVDNVLYTKLSNFTAQIPFLKKLELHYRFIAIAVLLVLVIPGIVFSCFALLIPKPTITEMLAANSWYVEKVNFQGNDYQPHTIYGQGILIDFTDYVNSDEEIEFRRGGSRNGTLVIPGFNSRATRGNWEDEDSLLRIFEVDTFSNIFNGYYTVTFSHERMVIQSSKTTIYCRSSRY